MTYFFVLGNNPALSLAELVAVLPCRDGRLVDKDLFVWETNHEIVPETLIKRLGGTIKIGIFEKMTVTGQDLLEPIVALCNKVSKKNPGKFNFGLSDYGRQNLKLLPIGLSVKKRLKDLGIMSRLVTSRERNLSSVVVEQNKLLTKGIEVVLAADGGKVLIGQTLAVQDFKGLSKRDYGRPARDDASGMLPPKIAQIMINLALAGQSDGLILDPFCGSGTVLQEALLLGFKEVTGTDLSPKAIADAKENIAWLKSRWPDLESAKVNIFLKNATKLSESFKANSVTAIVSEPYLGPQRGWHDLKLVKEELEALYTKSLQEFEKVLKPHGRVVMVWPMFFGNNRINPDYKAFRLINELPEAWQNDPAVKLTTRGTVVYGRAGQKVFREIVVLEKK
jgi:tRNA G10  N-methylase Trm11